eukprot:9467567-Pyramimonas_sp.AAC.1
MTCYLLSSSSKATAYGPSFVICAEQLHSFAARWLWRMCEITCAGVPSFFSSAAPSRGTTVVRGDIITPGALSLTVSSSSSSSTKHSSSRSYTFRSFLPTNRCFTACAARAWTLRATVWTPRATGRALRATEWTLRATVCSLIVASSIVALGVHAAAYGRRCLGSWRFKASRRRR